jgi:SAM-dependent methyltransferase
MFGLGGRFEYFECGQCGCIQLRTPPCDLSTFYPPTYYSFDESGVREARPVSGWRRAIGRARNQAQFFGGPWSLLARARSRPDLTWVPKLLKRTNVTRLDARILDVGCGSGALLKRLRQAGFTQLVGCDPYLSAPILEPPELRVLNCTIEDLAAREAGRFDLVMFHHSLEHIPEPIAPLRAARTLLKSGGQCLVAVPVASSEAWHTYGTDWVELDPPRHFFLHTEDSFTTAAREAGMIVCAVEPDGTPFEFWGSELYRRGMTLVGPDGQFRNARDLFTSHELQTFEHRATHANAAGRGGRALSVGTAADGTEQGR